MASRALNWFFCYSGWVFSLKKKILNTNSWPKAIFYSFVLLLSEIIFLVISLPLYLLVSPKKIQEKGWLFPKKEKENKRLGGYIIRRRIGLLTMVSVFLLLAVKVVFFSLLPSYLIGVQDLLAETQTWIFNNPSDYVYDSSKIEVTSTVARLKPTTVAMITSSTNPEFTDNASGWTYADWLQPSNTKVNGVYVGSGGSPDGHVEINMTSSKRGRTIAGYYQQPITISANSPDQATLSLDWKSIVYTSPTAPSTYKVYAFIDAASGAPTGTSTAIWSSPEITGTGSWGSSGLIDVKSKMSSVGTYYIKFAVYVVIPGTGNTSSEYTVGFDNVSVNWSKTSYSYPADRPAIEPINSLETPRAGSWDSFSETATKNGGEIYYQLSDDDGTSWKYWNGLSWEVATSSSNYNTALDVDSHIDSFSTTTSKIKWRAFLAGDGTQQVGLSAVSITYTPNSAPEVSIVSANQNLSNGLVYIDYNLTDDQGDPSDLINYEYSLTGSFSGEEVVMSASTTDSLHSGTTGLASSPTGVAHVFAWDAQSQLGKGPFSSVFVRLRFNDGIDSGGFAISATSLNDLDPPVVSNVAAGRVSTTADVLIVYDLSDDTPTDLFIEVEASNDGGVSWSVPVSAVSGDIGSGVSTGSGKTILWQSGVDYVEGDKDNMRIRVRARDSASNQGEFVVSNIFSVVAADANPPVVSNVSAIKSTSSDDVFIDYDLSDETATDLRVELEISNDGGSTWDVSTSSVEGEVGNGISVGYDKTIIWHAGIDYPGSPRDNMMARIRATDSASNQGEYVNSNIFSLVWVDNVIPIISDVSALRIASTSTDVRVIYDLFDDTPSDLLIEMEASSDGGVSWDVSVSSVSGDIGSGVSVGAAKSIIWLAGTDYLGSDKDNMRVRVRAKDALNNQGDYVNSNIFSIEPADVAPPEISNISVLRVSSSTEDVQIAYDLSDETADGLRVLMEVSADSGISWDVSTSSATGAIGSGISVGIGKLVYWPVGSDYFGEAKESMQVRLKAFDLFDNESPFFNSEIFSIKIDAATTTTTTLPEVINISTGSGYAYVDLVAPAKPTLNPISTPTEDSRVAISGKADPGVYIDLYDDNEKLLRLENPSDSNGEFSQIIELSEGEHLLSVIAIDKAGNASEASNQVRVNVLIAPPVAPIILIPKNNDTLTDGAPMITGLSASEADLEISIDGTIFKVRATTGGIWEFKLPIDYALTDGEHIISVKSIDSLGREIGPTEITVKKITTVATVTRTVAPTTIIAPATPITPIEAVELSAQAVVSESITPPSISNINSAIINNDIVFSGTAAPNKDVLVYIHSSQALIYRTKSDASGNWVVAHSQDEVELSAGKHTVYAVTVDSQEKLKSQPSSVAGFDVKKSIAAAALKTLDIKTTVLALVVMAMVFYWLCLIKNKRKIF